MRTIHYHLDARSVEQQDAVFQVMVNISSGIGDAIMAEPLIRAIRAVKPGTNIDVIAGPSTRSLFENHTDVRRVHVLVPRLFNWIQLILQLRKEKYDLYIGTIPSNTLSQQLLPWLANIPFRIKHRTPHTGSRDFDFLFHRIEPIPEGRHRLTCNLDLLKHIGISADLTDARPRIGDLPDIRQKALDALHRIGYNADRIMIGFHPGCNPKASFKRWSPQNYARLMTYLQDRWHAQILIVGGKDEEEDVAKIESLLSSKILNFVGKADLLETAELIRFCRFFVSNDSGIMHLATAVGVPVFAIFGPKDERHVGPYGNKNTVIRNGKEVNNVTVEQVIESIEQSEFGLRDLKK